MCKWETGETLDLIETEKIAHPRRIPMPSRELIVHPGFEIADTSTLKSREGRGASFQPDLIAKIEDAAAPVWPGTACGMTESCGISTAIRADFFVAKLASTGPAMQVFET